MSMTAHRSQLKERAFRWLCLSSTIVPLAILAVLLIEVGKQGIGRLDMDFIRSYPSRKPELAGILPALAGSAGLVVMTSLISIPLGIGAAIYLEEYGGRSKFSRLIEINIANLAAGVRQECNAEHHASTRLRVFGKLAGILDQEDFHNGKINMMLVGLRALFQPNEIHGRMEGHPLFSAASIRCAR